MLAEMLFLFGGLDWTALGAIAGLFGVVVIIAGAVANRVNKWRNSHHTEQSTDQRVMTTLFGKEANAPYPKIEGLVQSHADLQLSVKGLGNRLTALEETLGGVTTQINTLVERTEENGGGSIKDQLNMIEQYILEQNKKNGGLPDV